MYPHGISSPKPLKSCFVLDSAGQDGPFNQK